ncbi:MAG: 23S rRNA (uridine(2552)-2'-O)-methyltransferase RlmE [Gammaproteobacteria bacterium]|nr:23S rRNA (uridine(2552)-2'-O)-methyltransferase RlmE [Gammaproteobacteria bacterium]NNL00582.1 23S rRNA (uridine(2552)-2'-O)-methyltransferase RlmE [Xanthomonadales bacterium]
MAKSKSSRRWLSEHFDDQYVKMAQQQGWRSRAAFKLIELDEKYRLLRKGMRVVDLGSAPGSWTQVVQKALGENGRIIALDILPMDPLPGVTFIQGDFTEDEPLAELEDALEGQNADLVLSDMAPNMSGMGAVDQPRAMYLAELALAFAEKWLKPGGNFVVKVFQGEGFDDFMRQSRSLFEKVQVRKPSASRPRSREVYILGHRRKLQ